MVRIAWHVILRRIFQKEKFKFMHWKIKTAELFFFHFKFLDRWLVAFHKQFGVFFLIEHPVSINITMFLFFLLFNSKLIIWKTKFIRKKNKSFYESFIQTTFKSAWNGQLFLKFMLLHAHEWRFGFVCVYVARMDVFSESKWNEIETII